MPHNSKKAVFFDAAGTLFHPYPSVGDIYASIAAKHGMKVEVQNVGKAFYEEHSKRERDNPLEASGGVEDEKRWWKELVEVIFSKLCGLNDFDAFFEELFSYFTTAQAWRVYPDVRPTLEELGNRNIVTGVIANWDSRLFSVCRNLDLEKYFQFIFASSVAGSAKPSAEIFNQAVRRSEIALEQSIHVGDSVENDFKGARAAGMDVLIIDRKGTVDRKYASVPTIRSLEEVLRFTE
ncbi:MAG: HAD-IA family hydrolase [Chitinispirillaceae bacterium]